LFGAALLALTAFAQPASADQTTRQLTDVIPVPVDAKPNPRADFRLDPATVIVADRNARQVADYLGGLLRPSTGYRWCRTRPPRRSSWI
jgi:hexosaminidase